MSQVNPRPPLGPLGHAETASGPETSGSDCLVFSEPAERTSTFISKQGFGHVLFVDDEKLLVGMWKALLEMDGYKVTACISSLDALKAFRAAPECYDVVVTDQAMPNLSGETFAREILRIRPDIPILHCTGFSHIMMGEEARELGIRKLLMKPLIHSDLVLALQEVLEEVETPDRPRDT